MQECKKDFNHGRKCIRTQHSLAAEFDFEIDDECPETTSLCFRTSSSADGSKPMTYGEKYKKAGRYLANALEIKDQIWKLSKNGKHIICQSESDPKRYYWYRLENNNRFKCIRCRSSDRYSLAKVVEENKSKELWVIDNHENECLRMEEEFESDLESKIEECKEDEEVNPTVEVVKYGDTRKIHGERSTFWADALNVKNRLWKLSKDGKFILLQKQKNSNFCSKYLFKCQSCTKSKRYSAVKIAVEKDGSQVLWGIENHEKECLRMDEEFESDLDSECDENEVVNPTVEVVKYGDTRKIHGERSTFWADALNVKNRLWKLSKDGKFILLQKQKNSNLWYLFNLSYKNVFKCGRCLNNKRSSRLKVVDENDGSKSLWTIDNHDKECSKTYGKIINFLFRYAKVRKSVEKVEDFESYFTTHGKRQLLDVKSNMETFLTETRSNDEDEVVRYGDVCDIPLNY
uniref:Uncharacterized protein n=1 Tax=Panagrolaimus sp. JU765 TaxID=591449 RepID=A0AC34R1S7_9BILA